MESLAVLQSHELDLIHQEIDEVEIWLDQQRERLDVLVCTGGENADEPIEAIFKEIRQRISFLASHKARPLVRCVAFVFIVTERLTDVSMQRWFKFEERAIKRMDEVVSRLKQAILNARAQLWTMRLVRSFLASGTQRLKCWLTT
jgi:hypothetical protein